MTHIEMRALQIMGPNATPEELHYAEQTLTDRPEILNLFDIIFSIPEDKQAEAVHEILQMWGLEVTQ
jgi:hypothetical protein